MEDIRNCPFCNGNAKLVSIDAEKEFRKEKFSVKEFFYKCTVCGEEFTTTKTDEISINQVYNQYREMHMIPFPKELSTLREAYNHLSAQKMALILGLGINTYSNYEKGEMPSLANAKLISSAKHPEVFLSYLEQSQGVLTEGATKNLVKKLKEAISNDKVDQYTGNFNWFSNPNRYTGYSAPSKEKLSNLLLYFLSNCNPDYNDKLKLNKLLYYTDFIHYKYYGESVTGLSYRAIPYGPAPTNFGFIFSFFSEKEPIIESEFIKSGNSRVIECFKAIQAFDESVFDENELRTIRKVVALFKNTSSWDLVALSHQEKAWIDLNSSREIVSYQEYAWDLVGDSA